MDRSDTPATGPGGDEAADVRREVDRLKSDFARLRDDISDLTRAVGSVGRQSAAEARDRVRTRVNDAAAATADRGRDMMMNLEDEVRCRPFTSVSMAFLSGVFVGTILSHRR